MESQNEIFKVGETVREKKQNKGNLCCQVELVPDLLEEVTSPTSGRVSLFPELPCDKIGALISSPFL